jgi:predicted transcriptional regulator
MKTAISIPDPIFRKAEKLARRLRKSRSRLFSEAVEEYVSRHDPSAITSALDEVYGANAAVSSRPDRFVKEAARRVLRSVEW